METTANLELPYLMPSQAQKHVTHNEALSILDAVIQLSVRDRDLAAPTGTEEEGDRYIVADGATGPWSGWDGAIAARIDGAWRRIDPREGWIAWVEDEARYLSRADDEWQAFDEAALRRLQMLGVGTAADSANPFAAKLNKALWTARYDAEGGDGNLRYTMNKEGPSAVLSLLMQSDWSGRAEIGLAGDDDLRIKVSADGTVWKDALRIDRASGAAQFPQTPALAALAGLNGANGAFPRFTGAGAAVMQAIVGAVSQAGGVTTGAIVERGANANGEYVRFADGTQECWYAQTGQQAVNVATGSFFKSNTLTWTFPAVFVSGLNIQMTPLRAANDGFRIFPQAETITGSNCTYSLTSVLSGATLGLTLYLCAKGRWF